jgi:hypothetical protein
VLAYFFPADKETLTRMAEEASLSRLYGGIHYRFDAEVGWQIGQAVGQFAVAYAQQAGWK